MKITNRCLALSALQCIFILSWITSDVLGLQGASGKESTMQGLRLLTSIQLQAQRSAAISKAPPAWVQDLGRTGFLLL